METPDPAEASSSQSDASDLNSEASSLSDRVGSGISMGLKSLADGKRWTAGMHPVRLAVLASVLVVAAITWAIMPARETSFEAVPIEIAPAAQFRLQLSSILDGESDQLYINDFKVTSAILSQLPTRQWQDSIDSEAEFQPPLRTLLIDRGKVTDPDMAIIAAIPGLRHLRLRHSPITDASVADLVQCQTLWFINLPHCELTPAGVARLSDLSKLRQLRLGGPNLTSETAKAVSRIHSLRGIHLIGVPVNDEGLKLIADLPHLESLYLDDSS
ncbi:MAG: hypothetical protein AAF539_09885, partial [Planctomycetota bacterium]